MRNFVFYGICVAIGGVLSFLAGENPPQPIPDPTNNQEITEDGSSEKSVIYLPSLVAPTADSCNCQCESCQNCETDKVAAPESSPFENYQARWTWPGELDDHLESVHGVDPSGKSQDELEVIHDQLHEKAKSAKKTQNCPGGVCPTNRRLRLLPWRR